MHTDQMTSVFYLNRFLCRRSILLLLNTTGRPFCFRSVSSFTTDKEVWQDAFHVGAEDVRNQPLYGYAKRLEFKNRTKQDPDFEDELRNRIYKRTMTAEESLLTVDLLRKHKAVARDARRLRNLKKSHPEKARRIADFKPRPFTYNDPEADRIAQSVIQTLKRPDQRPPPPIDMPDVKLPEEEREHVGSLQNLKLRYGTPRPPRPEWHMSPFELPLSRPDLRPFHQIKPTSMTALDMHFAEWFIGLTEAQLPFSFTKEGRPYFAVQHNDMQLFRRMRAFLHFGHVDNLKQIWYVLDDENLRRIIRLLNGNLFLQPSRRAFAKWVEKYRALGVWNEEFAVDKEGCTWQPQPNNKWLTGFIDSNLGLYAGRLVEAAGFPHFRIQLKFWLLSNNRSLLEHLQNVFKAGVIEQDGDHLRWTIKSRSDHVKFHRYSRIFRPYSLKNVSVCRYDRLMTYPLINVRTEKAWQRLQNLVDSLNSFERKSALAMPFHPYNHRYKQNAQTQMQLARTGTPQTEIKAFRKGKEKQDFPWDTSASFTFITECD